MKKAFLFAASAAVLCSCSTQPKYVVEGDIAGLEGTVYNLKYGTTKTGNHSWFRH